MNAREDTYSNHCADDRYYEHNYRYNDDYLPCQLGEILQQEQDEAGEEEEEGDDEEGLDRIVRPLVSKEIASIVCLRKRHSIELEGEGAEY